MEGLTAYFVIKFVDLKVHIAEKMLLLKGNE